MRRLRRIAPLAASLTAVYLANLARAQVQTDAVLEKVMGPFVSIAELLVALSFGAGIVGFVITLVTILVRWSVGGSFGRSSAVISLIHALETLAIIPAVFLLVNVMGSLGDERLAAVANILNSMLVRGWNKILALLGVAPAG
ncbi:MAG: hypothetical protein DRK00_04665 [Thermoprotei archaeon]|nr:MAG: hypothetical protein DRK00_04665 [Thermoprotei archaeon]HDD34286.1 hypothetical protein [Thermofilaceae archaeon]